MHKIILYVRLESQVRKVRCYRKMYQFKKDKFKKLMGDKTVMWLSKQLRYTVPMLYNIFNNNINCRFVIAFAIVKMMNVDYEVEDFFDYIEEE